MNNRIHVSYRDYDDEDFPVCKSPAIEEAKYNNLLTQALNAQPQNDRERELLEDYIDTLKEIIACYTEINECTKRVNSLNNCYDSAMITHLREIVQKKTACIYSREQDLFVLGQLHSNLLKSILERNNEISQQDNRQHANCSIKEKSVNALGGVVFSVLGLLEFYLIYGLAFLTIGLVFLAVSYIPLISALVEWSLSRSDNTADVFAMMIAVALAYVGFTETAERVIKNEKTLKTTWIFTGICLAVINIIFLVANLIFHNAILVNIVFAIAGIVIFCKGKNKKQRRR